MGSARRRLPTLLVAALLAAACGSEASPLVERLAVTAPLPKPVPRSTPTLAPPPPVSASALTVIGDVTITDPDPDVMFGTLLAPLAADVEVQAADDAGQGLGRTGDGTP